MNAEEPTEENIPPQPDELEIPIVEKEILKPEFEKLAIPPTPTARRIKVALIVTAVFTLIYNLLIFFVPLSVIIPPFLIELVATSIAIFVSGGWQSISTIIITISAGIAAFAALFVILEVWELKRARYLQSTQSIINQLNTRESLRNRMFVYYQLDETPLIRGSKNWVRAWKTWTELDNIGVLLHKGLVYEHTIMELYHGMFIRLWDKLAPHVERESRHSPRYMTYAKWLVKRSWKWQETHHPENPVKLFIDERCRRDIEEFIEKESI